MADEASIARNNWKEIRGKTIRIGNKWRQYIKCMISLGFVTICQGNGWAVAKEVYPDSIMDQIPAHILLQIQVRSYI